MKSNVGTMDRVLRVFVGVLLIALTLGGLIGLWGWLGVLLIVSGAAKRCPAYSLLGINTCGK